MRFTLIRFSLIVAAMIACLCITRAQGPAIITHAGTVHLNPAAASTFAGTATATASLPAYDGPPGTLLGVFTKIKVNKVNTTYSVESGAPVTAPNNGCASYDGAYGGFFWITANTSTPNGQRFTSDVGGISTYFAMCGGVQLQAFDGQWDGAGASGHTAGGPAEFVPIIDYHDLSWSAYPNYQPGWENTEPSFPLAWYAHNGAMQTRLRVVTHALVDISEWTQPFTHWGSWGLYGGKNAAGEDSDIEVSVDYLHLQPF